VDFEFTPELIHPNKAVRDETRDFPADVIGKFYRDVRLRTSGEGTGEIQHLVIARQLLKT
jgi:alkylation response protein AidB-like acyl-CoA dehydrogenase